MLSAVSRSTCKLYKSSGIGTTSPEPADFLSSVKPTPGYQAPRLSEKTPLDKLSLSSLSLDANAKLNLEELRQASLIDSLFVGSSNKNNLRLVITTESELVKSLLKIIDIVDESVSESNVNSKLPSLETLPIEVLAELKSKVLPALVKPLTVKLILNVLFLIIGDFNI